MIGELPHQEKKTKSPPKIKLRCDKCFGVYAKRTHQNCGKDAKLDNIYDSVTEEEKIANRVFQERYKMADAKNEKTIQLASKYVSPLEVLGVESNWNSFEIRSI